MSRRAKRENVGVALFPFLAVLICTMGALIVLLVLNVQQASVEAKSIAHKAKPSKPAPQDLKKQQEALEEARWRQEVLEQQRKERQEALQESRLALSHLEDHIRRLDARGKELMELLERVEAGKQSQDQDLEATRQELAKLKDEIAKKQDELEKKKKAATTAEKWYALIPYDGPNGTRRMPIYVECVEEGVIIQPEGVLLTAEDFRGEPGPGNPLDAALRVKREYIMKASGGKAAEPYPLLVVRPSGVMAYTAARSYMKFWDDEFGYELISEEKKLDFGPRDPNLDLLMNKEIVQARKRQAVLAMAMPRKYNNEDAPRSFAPEDDPDVQRRRAATAGSGGGIGNGGDGRGIGGSGMRGIRGNGLGGNGYDAQPPHPPGTPGNTAQAETSNSPGTAIGPYGTTGKLAGGGTGGSGTGGSGSGGSNPGPSKSGGPRLAQPGVGTTSPGTGSVAGGNAGGAAESGTMSPLSGGAPSGDNANGGAPGGSVGGGSSSASGSSSGGTGGLSGSPGGSPAQGQPSPNIGVNIGPPESSPAATAKRPGRGGAGNASRGKNWGLPEAQRHVTGVTRPIRVTMQPDKLTLLPERADERRPQEIPLSPEMSPREVETLVAGVQRHMRSWGIAVDGGYWKPALSVDVRPGAEDRFAELQSALQGSGIEVQRKIR